MASLFIGMTQCFNQCQEANQSWASVSSVHPCFDPKRNLFNIIKCKFMKSMCTTLSISKNSGSIPVVTDTHPKTVKDCCFSLPKLSCFSSSLAGPRGRFVCY